MTVGVCFFYLFFPRQSCLIHQALLVLINVVFICIHVRCSHLRTGMISETRLLILQSSEIKMVELTFCVHLMDMTKFS